jgi:Zn-dependent protease with chaperone function
MNPVSRAIDYATQHSWVTLVAVGIWLGAIYYAFAHGADHAAQLAARATPQFVEKRIGAFWAEKFNQSKHAPGKDGGDAARRDQLAAEIGRMAQAAGVASVQVYFVDAMLQPNAFAVPGGHVAISKGLLSVLDDDGVLAVAAHEIAHLKLRHSLRGLYRYSLSQVALIFLGLDVLGGTGKKLTERALEIGLRSHGRDQEREADRMAVEILIQTGKDPRALAKAFIGLRKAYGNVQGSEWLSSHPALEERIRTAQEVSEPAKR